MVLRAAVTGPTCVCWAVIPSTGTCWVPPLSVGWVCRTGVIVVVLQRRRRARTARRAGAALLSARMASRSWANVRHRLAADADQPVTGLQPRCLRRAALISAGAGLGRVGGQAGRRGADDRRRRGDRRDQQGEEHQHDRQQEVHRRARDQHDRAAAGREAVERPLVVVGIVQLLERGHPDDLDEAAGRDGLDAVLGLALACATRSSDRSRRRTASPSCRRAWPSRSDRPRAGRPRRAAPARTRAHRSTPLSALPGRHLGNQRARESARLALTVQHIGRRAEFPKSHPAESPLDDFDDREERAAGPPGRPRRPPRWPR